MGDRAGAASGPAVRRARSAYGVPRAGAAGSPRIAGMDLRKEPVVVETDRYRVTGLLTLPAEGFRSRLSDHVNRDDLTFLTIEDARLVPLDGGEESAAEVLFLARSHVRLVMPG